MKSILEKTSPLLMTIIIGILISGITFGVFGVWLVYLGATGETEFSLLGQKFKSTNVGIGAIFIGAVIIVMTIKRAFKTIDLGMSHSISEMKHRKENPYFCENKNELAQKIKEILVENKTTWQTYGPESETAMNNPLSNASLTWSKRKQDSIIPNNDKILLYIENNKNFFSEYELSLCFKFKEHAEGFKASAEERREDVPRFPTDFEEVINNYVTI